MSKKGKVLVILIIVFALIFISACGYLIYQKISSDNNQKNLEQIASSYAVDIESDTTSPEYIDESLPEKTYPELEKVKSGMERDGVSFEELMEINPDVYAWIYVPDTNINYPVCQSSTDDSFYLHHDVYKDYMYAGTIYSQLCNTKTFNDRVTVLYGHNMANGSMFRHLHLFSEESFFNEHRYFYVYTPEGKLTYEIVSAFSYDDRHILNSFNFSDDEVFQEWLDYSKNPRSVYRNVNESVNLSLESKMLVLSTCLSGGDDGGRYLVEGVLISDDRSE